MGNTTSTAAWKKVTKSEPCEACGKPDWCSRSEDGRVSVCRRPTEATRLGFGGGESRTDENGAPFLIFFKHGRKKDKPAPEYHEKPVQVAVRVSPPLPNKTAQVASRELLDQVYRFLSERLGLSPTDKQAVLSRGFTSEDTEIALYFSIPPYGERVEIEDSLRERFRDALLQVPGFFLTQQGRVALRPPGGLCVPYRDADGYMISFQIRVVDKDARKHYIWPASKSKGDPSLGAVAHVSPLAPGDAPMDIALVTEGVFKADMAARALGMIAVAAPGIFPHPVLNALKSYKEMKRLVLAFDSDAMTNPSVATNIVNCVSHFRKAGYRLGLATWDNQYKGIDDAINAGVIPVLHFGAEVGAYLRALKEVIDHAQAQQQAHDGMERILASVSFAHTRKDRCWMCLLPTRHDKMTELAANTIRDAALCCTFIQTTRCLGEHGVVATRYVIAERPKACQHCNAITARYLADWIKTEWPESLAVARIPFPNAEPKTLQNLKGKALKLFRKTGDGSYPTRWVYAVDHLLIVGTKENLKRFDYAARKLGSTEGAKIVSARECAVEWFGPAWVSVGTMICGMIDRHDESFVYSPWIATLYKQTTANKAGQAILHIPSHEEMLADFRERRDGHDPGECPECQGQCATDLVHCDSNRKVRSWLGGPISNKDALGYAMASRMEYELYECATTGDEDFTPTG